MKGSSIALFLIFLLRYCNKGNCFEYHGCYDANGITHPAPPSTPDLTIDMCIAQCTLSGHCYAGAQFYRYCFCMDTLPDISLSESSCNYPCDGNPTQMCGANMIRSVYSAACAQPSTAETTTSTTVTTTTIQTTSTPTTVMGEPTTIQTTSTPTTVTEEPTTIQTTSTSTTVTEEPTTIQTTSTPTTVTEEPTTIQTTSTPTTGTETPTTMEIHSTQTTTEAPTTCDSHCCECCKTKNLSMIQLKRKLEEIKQILILPKNTTNTYKWSKMCMEDDRTSSLTIGYTLGIGLLSGLAAFIVFPDIILLFKHLKPN